jgi:O-antigen chain-terminating methyltransferase
LNPEPFDDLLARLERERQAADRLYNDALTIVDRAIPTAAELPAPPEALDRSRLRPLNDRWNILPSGPPPVNRSVKGRLRGFVWRLIGPPIQAQSAFNSTLVEHLNRSAEAQERSLEAVGRLRDAVQAELHGLARFQSLLVQYLQTITLYIDTKDRSLGGRELREHLALTEQRVAAVKREVDRLMASAPAAAAGVASPGPFAGGVESVTYVGFEDRFRGPQEDVRRRVEEYLPLLEAAGDVLDVGCGRGELLGLLSARGVRARGVDSNEAMVELCRSRGLDVERGDALSYLQRQTDGSIGGLVAIQVVEHFEPAYLARFLEAAYDKMKPGAPLVLETINAGCWMAFFETYIRDLTHQRPLHPDTLRYLVEATGFSAVDVHFRRPVSDDDRLDSVALAAPAHLDEALTALAAAVNAHAEKLNTRLFSSMDYAVIARR